MPRYLIRQPDTPEGLYGSIIAGEELPFQVGQVHDMPIRGGTQPWIVEAIRDAPKVGYDALVIFGRFVR